ncbi:hypothetical protein RJV04_002201 [Salmonella enterica]|nr:hypothetical protein [Salmonella enterica]
MAVPVHSFLVSALFKVSELNMRELAVIRAGDFYIRNPPLFNNMVYSGFIRRLVLGRLIKFAGGNDWRFIRDTPVGETDAPRTRFLLLHEQQDQLHNRNDDFKQQFDNCQSLNHHVVSSRERNATCHAGSSVSLNLAGECQSLFGRIPC